ncbi:MAG: hypothetical protein HGA45_08055 [Chloroflexales bacterium]|nr:hypothetical protein [Chloroflexales bacterium]
MELHTYLEILRRHRWYLLLIPLIAGLVALGATYLVAPDYVGTAVVQILPDDTEPRAISLRPQDGPGVVATGFRDPTEMLAQGVIQHLGSRAAAEQIAERMGLARLPEPTGVDALKARARALLDGGWSLLRYGFVAPKDQHEGIIAAVDRALDAELVRGSYYMTISATWRDRETAAAMANEAVQAVIDHSRQIASASAAEQRRFMAAQMEEARKRVEAARDEVLRYSQSGQAGQRSGEQALARMSESDPRLAALYQELELANDAYRQRTAQWYELLLEEARPATQIRLIDPAVPPAYPSAPIKIYWAGLGVAAGLTAALLLAFFRHSMDRSLRSPEQAEQALAIRLLAVVPTRSAARGAARRGSI